MRGPSSGPGLALPLYISVILIATCGLIYELLAGTLASYLLGDSVTQFSFVIGIYLSAMGVGAWLSNKITKRTVRTFLEVELGVALLGGISAPLLFFSFGDSFSIILYGLVFLIGTLVGLEIPLLMRILKDQVDFNDLVSRVLTFDYLGALFASVLFPTVLVPRLGLIRTSLLCGIINALVALAGSWILRPLLTSSLVGFRIRASALTLLLGVGFIYADEINSAAERRLFAGTIVYSKTSYYQRLIITKTKVGFQLYLNGHLQFSSFDEYRYHESLVHPAMLSHPNPKRVLILGGGDGLAAREVLRYPSVEEITLVDLDPAMTSLWKEFPQLASLNQNSLNNPKLTIFNQDAMIWLERETPLYDVVIIDFPDPSNFAIGKLYTTRFYKLLQKHLSPEAAVSIQTTSPLIAPTSYWCVNNTLTSVGFSVLPYVAQVPSFGIWGFALLRLKPFSPPTKLPNDLALRFLNDEALASLFVLSKDLGPVPAEVNRLDNQMLVRYYESEWDKWE
jgi:spermidine synthase